MTIMLYEAYRAFYFVGHVRPRDIIALPLTSQEFQYGPQLSLSALFCFPPHGRKRSMRLLAHCAPKARRRLCNQDCGSETQRNAGIGPMTPDLTQREAANSLREQAASCRRLARTASTPRGTSALRSVAEHFDADARRIDPLSERR